jgi:hypothetical protein
MSEKGHLATLAAHKEPRRRVNSTGAKAERFWIGVRGNYFGTPTNNAPVNLPSPLVSGA